MLWKRAYLRAAGPEVLFTVSIAPALFSGAGDIIESVMTPLLACIMAPILIAKYGTKLVRALIVLFDEFTSLLASVKRARDAWRKCADPDYLQPDFPSNSHSLADESSGPDKSLDTERGSVRREKRKFKPQRKHVKQTRTRKRRSSR